MLPMGIYSHNNQILSKSISFKTPGLVQLPSWLTFSCSSTRTAQTSSSTIIRGVPTNQAVCNLYGLQHEPQATNYCEYSENFAATGWGANNCTVYSSTSADPAGNNTAGDMGVPASKYGGFQGFFGFPIVLQPTLSGWIKTSGTSPNQANFGMLNMSGGYNTGDQIWITPGTSWQRVYTTSPASYSFGYVAIGDQRMTDDLGASRSQYAFLQAEGTIYPTSYIPVPGTTAVTRTASILQASFTNTSNFTFTVEAVMALPSTSTSAFDILCNSDSSHRISITAAAKLQTVSGNTVTSSTVLSWSSGDKVRWIIKARSSATINITTLVNGVQLDSENITNSTMHTFSANNYVLSRNDSSNFAPIKGIILIGVL